MSESCRGTGWPPLTSRTATNRARPPSRWSAPVAPMGAGTAVHATTCGLPITHHLAARWVARRSRQPAGPEPIAREIVENLTAALVEIEAVTTAWGSRVQVNAYVATE